MNDRDILRKERLDRVSTFHIENQSDFAAGSLALTLFDQVDGILAALEKAQVGQIRTPVTKTTLLEALRLDLQNIARTARAIRLADAIFPTGDYSPAPTAADAEEMLLTHADAVLTLLEDAATDTPAEKAAKAALRQRFTNYEIEADFVEDLRADRKAIDDANQNKHADNLEGNESTSAIDTLLLKGGDLVTQLDAIMRNKYKRDPDKLHAWTRASRIERSPKPQKPEDGANPGGTPPPTNPPQS
jgi:hypothetical protein